MPLLRRKLSCFYCGCRSAKSKEPGLRCWQCENCEAENWLDENGEITDPPASASSNSQTIRYTSPEQKKPHHTVDPVAPSIGDELFCQTCQKNQHLYTQSLSSFYPSPTRDNFEEFARAESEYRAGLEERYPLICEACEPRVQERLKRVNYNAKADHMARVIARLKGGPHNATRSWKGWAIWIAGWFWLFSWTVQITWHLLGTLPLADDYPMSVSFEDCAHHLMAKYEVIPACVDHINDRPIIYGLLAGIFTLWWHRKRMELLEKRYERVTGVLQFYKIQAASIIARVAAVYCIRRKWFGNQTLRALNVIMVPLCVFAMVSAYFAVKVDNTPKVSFKESPEPLIKKKSHNQMDTANSQTMSSASLRRGNAPLTRPQPFNINDLAPRPPRPSNPRLPTPPPEADYDDPSAMEWTAAKPHLTRPPMPFKPVQQSTSATSSSSTDSPFHGRLPASIVSPAHRLRNPPNKPTFRAAAPPPPPPPQPGTHLKKKKFEWPKPYIPPIPEIPRAKFPPGALVPQSRGTGHPLDLSGLDGALSPSPTSTSTDVRLGAGRAYEEDGMSVFSDLSPTEKTYYHHQHGDDNDGDDGGDGAVFANPRFFGGNGGGAKMVGEGEDTGLEGMMERVFRIGEEPEEVRELRGRDVAIAVAVERERKRKRRVWMLVVGGVIVGVVMDAVYGTGIGWTVGEPVVKKGVEGMERAFVWLVYQ